MCRDYKVEGSDVNTEGTGIEGTLGWPCLPGTPHAPLGICDEATEPKKGAAAPL